jgi:hypothetical protein
VCSDYEPARSDHYGQAEEHATMRRPNGVDICQKQSSASFIQGTSRPSSFSRLGVYEQLEFRMTALEPLLPDRVRRVLRALVPLGEPAASAHL